VRTPIFVSAVCVSALLLPSLALTQEKKTTTNYLPLKVGNTWNYEVKAGGMEIAASQKVTKIEKKDGKDVATIETTIAGQSINEQMSSTEKGIYRHSYQGVDVDPPILIMQLPVKKGDTWTSKFKIMGQELSASMKTEGEEKVTVPAGKYDAVVISMEMELMGQKITSKSWFAPNVGIVKQQFNLAGTEGTMELKEVKIEK